MQIKRIIYISLFTVLGILLQFLLHAGIEIGYGNLLLKDFLRYGFGLTWQTWFLIHHSMNVVLFVAGALFGFWQGKYWWKKIYERKNTPR